MVTLARVRLLLARHPVVHWCAVASLAAGAAWLSVAGADAPTCPADLPGRVTSQPGADPTVLGPGEVAVAVRGIPGAAVGSTVRVYALGATLTDGRIVAVSGADLLVAVPESRAGAASLAAADGTATLGLLGDGGPSAPR